MPSIQCAACGYVTNDTRDRLCVRCNTPLEGLPEPAPPTIRPPRPMPPPQRAAAPAKRSGGRAVLLIGLALVVAAAAALAVFYLVVVKPRTEAGPSQAELKQRLTTQPDFRGDAEFVEGKMSYRA
jgi:hypothetical protein